MKKIFKGKLQDLSRCYLPDVMIKIKGMCYSDINLEIVIGL